MKLFYSFVAFLTTVIAITSAADIYSHAIFFEVVWNKAPKEDTATSLARLGVIALNTACTNIAASRSNISDDNKHDFYGAPMTATKATAIECSKSNYNKVIRDVGSLRQFTISTSFAQRECITPSGLENCANRNCTSVMCNTTTIYSTVIAYIIIAVLIMMAD